jgi:hypothetical protein
MSKSDFIRSLQFEPKALSPFDISQRLRQQYSCVSIYQGDPDLDFRKRRGYMVRYQPKAERTPENPELYTCVIALNQSPAWQDLVWAKEILHILDGPGHATHADNLGDMLDSRAVNGPTGDGTPLNVMADKNGFILALGCKIPHTYRVSLRKSLDRPGHDQLEKTLMVPTDFIEDLLNPKFEEEFATALAECDHEG